MWTLVLFSGMLFLWTRRHRSMILGMRGLGMCFFAIGILHCYWVFVQLGYSLSPSCTGDAEYWIMGTWFSLGIGLFHASNGRLLHVATVQRRFYEKREMNNQQNETVIEMGGKLSKSPVWACFGRMSYSGKGLVLVGIGMGLQVRRC